MADHLHMDHLHMESPFGAVLAPTKIGTGTSTPGVTLAARVNATQVEIAAFSATAPILKKAATLGDLRFAHAANRMFIVSRQTDLLPALRKAIPPAEAAIIDQSHGRACIAAEGPRVADALSKLFAIDFDPRAFPAGTGIATAHHVMFALIYRQSETQFLLFPHRSFARDFAKSLIRAATEYGLEIKG